MKKTFSVIICNLIGCRIFFNQSGCLVHVLKHIGSIPDKKEHKFTNQVISFCSIFSFLLSSYFQRFLDHVVKELGLFRLQNWDPEQGHDLAAVRQAEGEELDAVHYGPLHQGWSIGNKRWTTIVPAKDGSFALLWLWVGYQTLTDQEELSLLKEFTPKVEQ